MATVIRPRQIVVNNLVLTQVGQELTIIRFRLDSEGILDEDALKTGA